MKTWFITGTSRGFGREWAIAALERGDQVAATARNLASLDDLAAKHGDAILPIALDVTDRDADFAAIKRAHEQFGRLDIIVNNAGYGHFGMVEELSEAEIRAQLETNVLGAVWVTQAALPYLREQGSGHILQVSSIGGVSAFMNTGAYHASKWALEGFSQSLAQEVAQFGVKVTLIEPPATRPTGPARRRSAPPSCPPTTKPASRRSHPARPVSPSRASRPRPGRRSSRWWTPRTRRSGSSSASHRWGSRPPTTTRGWPPGANGSRWPPPPRADQARPDHPAINSGVSAAIASMTGSRPGRAVMILTMASSSPALSRSNAAGAAAAGP